MGGLILITIIIGWFYLVKTISYAVVSNMNDGFKKTAVLSVMFIILLSAPVIDEIIGGFQFRALCQQGTKLVYEEKKVRGKTLIWSGTPKELVEGTIIPIYEADRFLAEQTTNEILIEFKEYYASGGWLSRAIGVNTKRPYTFNGVCGAKKAVSMLRDELNIKTKFIR
jgi:hypothetical protein